MYALKRPKPKNHKPKLRHTYKTPIKGLLRSLLAHEKISLPDRGKDKDKIII
jgi:hypothetical protein